MITGTVFAFLCVAVIAKSATKHNVPFLPGYGPPPTKHYTGFVPVCEDTGATLFYYFVESASQPSQDPVIWWMNGGPGASSLAGFLGENGPLLLSNNGRNLIKNPYSWNRRANLLYVEFAPGIGYSYCDNSANVSASCVQSSGECSPCSASDESVARQNRVFYETFVLGSSGSSTQPALFPWLKGQPLFLTGESYAGVYIPTLALELLTNFKEPDSLNLQGLWMTDPCTDNEAQFGWLDVGLDFSRNMGLISESLYATLSSSACTSGRTPVGDRVRNVATIECRSGWRLYDIATAGIGDAVHPAGLAGLPMYVDPLSVYGHSGGPDLEGYFNKQVVREALATTSANTPNNVYHMEIGNNGYPQYTLLYAACNDAADANDPSMIQVYQKLLAASRSSSLRTIIVSSGTSDPVVSLQGTEKAVHKIGLKPLYAGVRRPWFYNCTATDSATMTAKPYAWGPDLTAVDAGSQVGGFITNFETNAPASFSFITVRGSGHMVPAYAPQSTLHIIEQGLLRSQEISPALPEHWDDSDHVHFYGDQTPGLFAQWVGQAMAPPYV